jgi:hypothetical protein
MWNQNKQTSEDNFTSIYNNLKCILNMPVVLSRLKILYSYILQCQNQLARQKTEPLQDLKTKIVGKISKLFLQSRRTEGSRPTSLL